MNFQHDSREGFLAREHRVVIVEIAAASGSTPRDAGTLMLVAPSDIHGTVGGGPLEQAAIENARRMLANAGGEERLSIPLGPEIGECCGGAVDLSFAFADEAARRALDARLADEEQRQPQVWVFGAGHVGRALAEALALLPLNVFVVEARENERDQLTSQVHHRQSSAPETLIAGLPAGSAVVVVTHDHALDFRIGRQALARTDLAYVGMVGSRAKREAFLKHLDDEGMDRGTVGRLSMPIGGGAVADKRPGVIAAMTTAEILLAFAARP